MDSFPCRECGHVLSANLRDCPRCALNLEAETMIDRFVWRRLLPALVVLVIVVVGVVFYVAP